MNKFRIWCGIFHLLRKAGLLLFKRRIYRNLKVKLQVIRTEFFKVSLALWLNSQLF